MANEFDDLYSSPEAVRLAKSVSAPRAERPAAPYRRATTPQILAQNAFFPEDENRAAEMERVKNDNWVNWYNKNLGPDAIRQLSYDGAIQLGWDEQRANKYADHMRSKAVRGEHLMMDAPLAGAVMGVGTEAYNTARSVMTGTRAAETAAPHMLALPPPRPGPSSPIGRGLSGETIEAGRPPVNPATDYRLASEQGQRVGPNRPSEALRPVVDETYTLPEQLNRTPEVRTAPTPLQTLRSESPMADRQLGATQQAGRDAEAAFRERQAAIAEAEGFGRPMTQSDKDFAQFQKELAATEERGAGAQFTPPAAAGEPRSPLLDMPAPGVKRRLTPAAEPAPAQPVFDFGGPQSTTGSFSPVIQGQASTTNAYAKNAIEIAKQRADAMRRSAADASGQQAAIDAAAQRVAAERAASPNALIDQAIADVTGQAPAGAAPIPRQTFGLRQRALVEGVEAAPAAPKQAASAAPAAAGPASGPWGAIPQPSKGLPPGSTYTPSMAAAPATPAASISGLPTPRSWTLADTALGAGSLGVLGAVADRQERRQKKGIEAATERQRIDDMEDAALAASRGRSQNAQNYSQFSEYGDPTKMFEENYANFQRYGSPKPPAQTQLPPAVMGGNAPAQQRPASAAPAGGGSFLDKIFSGKDYQSSGGLLQQKQDGNRVLNWGDSDSAADFFRADAMKRRLEDQQQQFTGRSGSDIDYENRMASEGKARGGAAEQKPSKEAMLHKSLEIIHHMIKNR
jgi:hypothetical protein